MSVTWTGTTGAGASGAGGYGRNHEISAAGKPLIRGSSDPAFRGDPSRWNPEELLLASLSACHKLWYLDLCARSRVVVTAYVDQAQGVMEEEASGAGRFIEVALRPHVTISATSDIAQAQALHHRAHDLCFIARSVNFPVSTHATVAREAAAAEHIRSAPTQPR